MALVATLVVSVLPQVTFAYRSPAAHVAIETAAAVIALVAAYLVLGRFRSTARIGDLALFCALTTLALTNAGFSTAPALAGAADTGFTLWSSLSGRLLGALAICAAAFAPARTVADPRLAVRRALIVVAALMGVAAATGLAAQGVSPGLDPELSPADATRPRIVGSAALLTCQVAAFGLYALAAAGFTRRAGKTRDELLAWFAVGATLSAASRLNYFLFPSIVSEYVFTGDVLRLCYYLALLLGALRAITAYQRTAAAAAILDERRRIARDLHDGLAQELAFISGRSRRMAAGGDTQAQEVAEAAVRALDESRSAIAALSSTFEAPLAERLADAAQTVARRAGAVVRLRLDAEITVPGEDSAALVRVVREAVTNAVRHGGATEIQVELERNGGTVLRIRDNGGGFDVAAPPRAGVGGFGITSMRERVAELGGHIEIRSRHGEGALVEVRLP